MEGVGLIGTVVIGVLAGWIAERIMNRSHGVLTNLVVGLAGSLIGAWLAGAVGLAATYGFWANLGLAVLGSVTLLLLLGFIKR
jgi:uncharacterized membrane protein YeaQ/YmgE (transglycosylase-associated protein family)